MSSTDNNKFPAGQDIATRFQKWTQISDPDVIEALTDLTGDTFFEMRKLISQELSEVENMVTEGKYCGFMNGKELTDEQKESIKELKEDLKEFLRVTVEATWRSILNKQKIGIDKLGIALKPFINGRDKTTEVSDAGDE